ncbi:hypothetical protein MJO28_016072 [Puccinia striiformis f. sp. tritici]|uniref:Uncharacterized protein n=1 Tax=Puccinia striiformis f. sp. tritici TaxID=168172 RepID=A0ACC0DQN7_9BASI|nr:hypothetical protein MJO28_016072 [Puccinia striiformis f. sp. tritici]
MSENCSDRPVQGLFGPASPSTTLADPEEIQDLHQSPSGSPSNKQLNLGTKEDNIKPNNSSNLPSKSEKLDKFDFTDWQWAIFNALSCKDLDGLVVKENSDKTKADLTYSKNCKAVSSFIQLHITTQNLEKCVKDLYVHDPKQLWGNLINHF